MATGKPWADGPYPLIETPSKTQDIVITTSMLDAPPELKLRRNLMPLFTLLVR